MSVKSADLLSDYVGDAKILLISAAGKGQSRLTFENMESVHKMKVELVEKDGKEYLKINKYKFKSKISKLRLQFTGLLNGNPTLEQAFNSFLNESWMEIYKEFGALQDQKLEKQIKKIVQQFFDNNPYRELFLQ
jgi:hypothetical protein